MTRFPTRDQIPHESRVLTEVPKEFSDCSCREETGGRRAPATALTLGLPPALFLLALAALQVLLDRNDWPRGVRQLSTST